MLVVCFKLQYLFFLTIKIVCANQAKKTRNCTLIELQIPLRCTQIPHESLQGTRETLPTVQNRLNGVRNNLFANQQHIAARAAQKSRDLNAAIDVDRAIVSPVTRAHRNFSL